MSGNRLSAWHRLLRCGLRLALLREDGTPRRLARQAMFTSGGRPRRPFARTIFRKNGLPRDYLDEDTRDFLGSPLLADWIRQFDSPAAPEMDRLAATAGLLEPGLLLVELDDALLDNPERLAARLDLSGHWRPMVRFLPGRDLTAVEVQRLGTAFGSAALTAVDPEYLPDQLVLLMSGALPRPYGTLRLLAALQDGAGLVYGDEARELPDGTVAGHWFKPSRPSPLLARQGNLLGRMVALDFGRLPEGAVLQRELLAAGADRRRILSDLAARLAEPAVRHVPHLCHLATGPREPLLPLPDFPLPASLPVVSILIPTRDGWPLLSKCLASLEQTDWPSKLLEIVIVDNGSTDPACLQGLAELEAAGRIRLIRHAEKFNYARINNIAARQARGDLLVLLNNDTEVLRADWLKRMVSFALQDDVGAVGPKLLYEDRTVQHAGVVLGMNGGAVHEFVGLGADDPGYQGLAATTREIAAVTAACLAIRRAAFDAIGGFNESFEVAFNDVVLCCDLVAAGYRNIYLAEPLFLHLESKTRGANTSPEKLAREEDECRRAIAIHPGLFAADPYYSPNLSLDVFFKPAFPPRTE